MFKQHGHWKQCYEHNSVSGIHLEYSTNNSLVANDIENNALGIYFALSSHNRITYNNFIDNPKHVDDGALDYPGFADPSISIWDNGVEGNHWSNYNGTDNDGDGIGDTPYIIDENNQDNYPLMNPVDIATIPELPSWTVMLVILTLLAVAIAIYRRRMLKTPIHHS